MTASKRTPSGLATRIVRLTLSIGILTVTVAGIVALMSTSRLATERAAGRDLLGVQMVESAIVDRLSSATGTLERASALVSSADTPRDASKSVAALFAGSRSIFGEMVLVDASKGRALVVSPLGLKALGSGREQALERAREGANGIIRVEVEEDLDELWVVRTTVTRDGSPLILLGRLDTRFIISTLERAARLKDNRYVMLLSGEEVVAVIGTDAFPRMGTATWNAEGEGIGQVTLGFDDGTRVRGYYNDIEGAEALEWRVLSVKPVVIDTVDTVRAVAPSLLVLSFGGIIAVAAAWMVVSRLVRPLRELERTARNAAAGAYVKPLAVTSDDEIGRVSVAFNQVALRLNALHDLSQLLASASRLDQVLDGILSAVGHIVGPGAAAIYLLDEAHEVLTPVRTRGIALAGALPVSASEGGWLASTLAGLKPVVLSAETHDLTEEIPGVVGKHAAAVAAPLVAGHEALGVVVILKDGSVPVSEAELEMVRTFSAQAAVAVQTSELFAIESESRHLAETLRVVAEELVRPAELDVSLDAIETIIAGLFSSPIVRILVSDREALGLASGREPQSDAAHLTLVKQLIEANEGRTVIVPRGVEPRADSFMEDAAAMMMVPIGLDGDHGGALVVALSGEPTRSDPAEIGRALADEISLALDNAYFYHRAMARATNLETIFRISQAVGSSLQVNVVLNRVLDVVQKILSADAVMLWSYDARRRTLGTAMVRGAVPAGILHLELAPGEDLPGRIFDSGHPLVMRHLSESNGGVAGSVASQGLRSLLGVPLLARGRSIGVLMVFSTASDSFTDEEMNVLQTFASQAALAIDTASLYSREHEVAYVLQQSILPKAIPRYPGIETGSVYAPAGSEAEIGGDYYDLFRATDGTIWFSIADVCGKGVQAATKTSMIKYAVRALVAAGLTPGRVVAEVNTMVAESGDASDIVTLWAGRYDSTRGSLVWASGGHPPGMIRRTDGTLDRLSATGPLLGAIEGIDYDESSVDVAPGDRILLYTDGVTEARKGNNFFGEDRVTEVFSGEGDGQEEAARLLNAVKEFAGEELKDDIALLVVTITGDSESPEGTEGETVDAGV